MARQKDDHDQDVKKSQDEVVLEDVTEDVAEDKGEQDDETVVVPENLAEDSAITGSDEVAELEVQLKRAMADFDNYRRRSEEEKRQLSSFVQAQTLLEVAPVLDNFRRATEHLPKELEDNNWAVGVLYVQKQLEQIFEQFGLEKIKTIGEDFDPRLHEAISMETVEGTEPNKVLAEVESGYLLKGQVLKPARVKVSS